MKFTRKIKSYDIDLSLPEKHRWDEVIEKELTVARRVVRAIKKNIYDNTPWYIPDWFTDIALIPGFGKLYKTYGGLYLDEMDSWAEALGCGVSEFLTYQCAYELSHLGCTAGIVQTRSHGMLHLRTLDWPLKSIGPATRLFHFSNGSHRFTTVGIVGMIGALSGMVPGKYSATINYAPADGRPSVSKMGVLFHLRNTFEECSEYEDAVRYLSRTPVSTNVFFTVCGARNGEACVIERAQDSYSIRKFTKPSLVQANHYVKRFRDLNMIQEDLYEDSVNRFDEFTDDSLPDIGEKKELSDYLRVFKGDCVTNEYTQQKMIFCPRSGKICVERRCP